MTRGSLLMILCLLALGTPRLRAQELPGPASDPVQAPLAGPTTEVTSRGDVSPGTVLQPGAGTDTKPDDSRLPIQLGLNLAAYYDDNIFIQAGGSGRKVGDMIDTIVPSISFNSAQKTGVDNSVQVSYSPGFVIYEDHSSYDTFEDSGSFVYGYRGARCDLTVTQQYASVQNSAPDQGDLVKVHQYLTTANFDYTVSSKINLMLHAEQTIIDYDQGFESKEWTGAAYVNYEVMPKTTIGLGGLAGVADIEGPNQTFEQANARVTYAPTQKLTFNATVGGEFRQTDGSSTTTVTPVFSLGLDYVPWNDTDISLNAYRTYDYSAKFYGQDYVATGFSGAVTQTFADKLKASFTASYENARYEDNLNDEESDLEYNYFTLRPALDYTLTPWCRLGAYYQYRRNVSNTLSAFIDQQVGVQARFTY